MRIFLDTANAEQIREAVSTGIVSGVTTNPTIISRENKPFGKCISDILAVDQNLTILAEVIAADTDGMIKEARDLSKLSDNMVVKIPMTSEGLAAVKVLSQEKVSTAVTLVFSLNQAIAASCAGADYAAAFVGRLDDINADGVGLIGRMKRTFELHKSKTKIMAASIRTPQAVAELFMEGCDVVTMPGGIFKAMLRHPLTDAGLEKFNEDWQKVPKQ